MPVNSRKKQAKDAAVRTVSTDVLPLVERELSRVKNLIY